ncbi:MAG: hypothetical protein B6241_07135 [Spirochaetaceae bacterium 4572_59]|nr:MAG: hypothetical protein B6241_07135 [Spirochaetaceae bacterium 4572_59]
MNWKKLQIVFLTVIFLTCNIFTVTAKSLEDEYLYGLDLFKEARYDQASRLFKTVLFDIGSTSLHGNAAYWLSRTYLEMEHYPAAMEIMEEFLLNFPGNKFNLDGQYYKGRLLYLEAEYDKAIHYFSSFITAELEHNPYITNSLFWIGESLYSLGRFEEAEEIYRKILDDFPTSIKVEASNYKISLIEYKYREEELLKLLQWSHEEFLKSSSEYEKKEKEFNQALKVYQDKLKELTTTREIYENRLNLLSIKDEALKIKEKLIYLSISGAENE